jgi:hypothetical protein
MVSRRIEKRNQTELGRRLCMELRAPFGSPSLKTKGPSQNSLHLLSTFIPWSTFKSLRKMFYKSRTCSFSPSASSSSTKISMPPSLGLQKAMIGYLMNQITRVMMISKSTTQGVTLSVLQPGPISNVPADLPESFSNMVGIPVRPRSWSFQTSADAS